MWMEKLGLYYTKDLGRVGFCLYDMKELAFIECLRENNGIGLHLGKLPKNILCFAMLLTLRASVKSQTHGYNTFIRLIFHRFTVSCATF
jgi:hypothetical protein